MADDPVWGRRPRLVHSSAGAKEEGDGEQESELIEDGDEWVEAELEKRHWFAPGYVMEGSVTILAGLPAAGKSLIAIGMAVSCGLGQKWGRFTPEGRLRVSLLNVEDDIREQRKRTSASLRQFPGYRPADLTGWVRRLHPKGSPVLLRWTSDDEQSFRITPTRLMDDLEAHVIRFRPHILFLDPMAEIHNAEENRNEVVKAIVAYLRAFATKYHLGVVLIHHMRKGSNEGAGDADGVRGGGAISAAARVVLTCMPMTEKDATFIGTDPSQRFSFTRVDGAKLNYGAMGNCDWYEKEIFHLDNEEDTPAVKPWQPPVAATVAQDLLLILEDEIAKGTDGDPYSPKMSGEARSVRHLLRSREISANQEKAVMENLSKMGIETRKFIASNRKEALGLRSKDGYPAARWRDGQGIQPDDEVASVVRRSPPETASVYPKNASVSPAYAAVSGGAFWDMEFPT